MSRFRLLCAGLMLWGGVAVVSATASPSSSDEVVRVSARHEPHEVGPAGRTQVQVRLDIRPGWHVNAHQPASDALIPTTITFQPNPFLEVSDVRYPAPVRRAIPVLHLTLDVYQGQPLMIAEARVSTQTSAHQTVKLAGAVRLQACSDDMCLRPATIPFELPIHLTSNGPEPSAPTTTWWHDLLGGASVTHAWGLMCVAALVGGLALNLTPCVYPMIPVTIAFFSTQASGRVGQALLLGALYVLGMSVTSAALGVIAAQTGALFGSWLQQPAVLVGMAAVMLALALSLFGVYELRPPAWIARRFGTARSGRAGAFVMGLVVGFIATPCIGPFVLGLLVFVGRLGNPWMGFWLFLCLGLGMGLPFLLVALLSSRLAALPKAGAWLVWPKRLLGVVLCAMAFYFLRPVLPQAARPSGAPAAERSRITWQPYTAERLADAARQGRPAIVDVYADWCVPCVELDHVTFRNPDVAERINGRFVALRLDATGALSHEDEELTERYDIYGVPTVLIFDAQGREHPEWRLSGFVTPEEFLRVLDRVERR